MHRRRRNAKFKAALSLSKRNSDHNHSELLTPLRRRLEAPPVSLPRLVAVSLYILSSLFVPTTTTATTASSADDNDGAVALL
uniref:Uncharacterized protein n=1 Tax=Panagrellus redivivus TaxID=6233 RepID=A0A7E4V295_PANRE